MSDLFGTDYNGRKAMQIFEGAIMYFPKAFAAMAAVSVAGNAQHNPGEPLHWARGKSMDQYNTALRHMMDHRMGGGRAVPFTKENNGWIPERYDTDGVRHLAKALWRIAAALELDIEAEEAEKASPKAGVRDTSQPIPDTHTQEKCQCGERVFTYYKDNLRPYVIDPTDGSSHSVEKCFHSVERYYRV